MAYHNTIYHYRSLLRPDDDVDVNDIIPVIPPADTTTVGRRRTRDFHREIAWTIDYRGDNDDIPTLLFVGAGYTLVKKVFMDLFGKESALLSGFRIYRDYYLYQRQARAWVRIAVELRGFDSDMMSIPDLGMIIQCNITKLCHCNIKYVRLNKFLNL